MHRASWNRQFAHRLVLATSCFVFLASPPARGQLRPNPEALADAPPELVERLRADPFVYFRFINRAWTSRVCELFDDVRNQPRVRIHGDAHLEQFAFTSEAWGLDDFDESTRGPAFVDMVRFLGSIDLATRQRGWTRDRDALWNRFLEGYRRGLTNPDGRPPEPGIVRYLRQQAPVTRAAFLAWGEELMQPMEEGISKSVIGGMASFERFVRSQRSDLASGYFDVKRAGWLRIGIGSAATRKILIRVQGPTPADDDDELLEGKEVTNLEGVRCLAGQTTPRALRVVHGAQQLGRLKHNILAMGPTMLIPAAGGRAEHSLDWWLRSWEPSYREVRLDDLRTVEDLDGIAYDAGVQLGSSEAQGVAGRKQALASLTRLEDRLRKVATALVEELLAEWRQFAGR
jgi:uncharacterized protein (DUF2252 family)